MCARAILTAFSTASAPLFSRADFFSWSPGVSSASSSHTSTYPSYGVTMKHVWVNARTWSTTRSTTCGAALPTLATAIPEARSISELPSASTTTPPPAASTNTGSVVPTPRATWRLRRAIFSRERGPGIGGHEPALLGEVGAADGAGGVGHRLSVVSRTDLGPRKTSEISRSSDRISGGNTSGGGIPS